MSVREHDHGDILEWDCCLPCDFCGEYGPHQYSEDAYCDLCGRPHAGYYGAIRALLQEKVEKP